jgi:hypothetical protein
MPATDKMLWMFPVCSSMLLQSLLTVGAHGLSPVVCHFAVGHPAICLLMVHMWVWLFALNPFSLSFQQLPPPIFCTSFQFNCLFSFFFLGRGISLSRGVVLVYPSSAWGIPCNAWFSPVWSSEGLPSTCEACIQQRRWGRWHGSQGPLVSQYVMEWRSLPWARGSGCQSFKSPWGFTSTKHP